MMMRSSRCLFALACVVIIAGVTTSCSQQDAEAQLPPLKTQPNPQAVVDEHLDALNSCDWERLIAQYPEDAHVFSGSGVVVGREQVGEMFRNAVKPFSEGGLCGVKFVPQQTFIVDGTVNVFWHAEGDVLAEPYPGSDAYVTKDGLMSAMVTTFVRSELKGK